MAKLRLLRHEESATLRGVMLPNWLRRIWPRSAGRSQPAQPQAPSPPTPRTQWTVGAFFDTSGWRLTSATSASMTWAGDVCGEMTLTRYSSSDSTLAQPIDLEAARRQHRTRAAGVDGGIVSVEAVSTANGGVALETIIKRRRGRGFGFDGLIVVPAESVEYALRITADEGFTGGREAVVNAKMLELGEIDLAEVMSAPPGLDGARPVKAVSPKDPYDSLFDDTATYAPSDDVRPDPLFPAHPLTIVRATLQRLSETWLTDDAPRVDGSGSKSQASPGPRRLLSEQVVRELYWMAGRNDLLEAELTAAIASAEAEGRGSDAAAARLWTMLGLVRHNAQNVLTGRNTLRHAVEMLTKTLGDQRETGCALVLLGRSESGLSRFLDAERSFRRAVAILEKLPDAQFHLRNALALLTKALADQGRLDDARSVLERLNGLPAPDPRDGLELLNVLVGGPSTGITTTTKAID